MSEFDMNNLLRSYVRDDGQAVDESPGGEPSIGGRSDAGAGQERVPTDATDMNSWLRDAVFESRGRPV